MQISGAVAISLAIPRIRGCGDQPCSKAGPCSASMRVLWEQDQTQPGFPNLPALYSPL